MTTDGLTRLTKLADDLGDAEAEVARLDADLKAAQRKVVALAEQTIPNQMDELGIAEFRTKSGLHIQIIDKLSARKLNQSHAEALQWLRDNGQAGLIKTVVGIPFSAGSETDADELVEQLAGEGFAASKGVEVHHSSLGAAIKSMLADGVDVPVELLGGFQRRVAKVQR